MTNEPVWGSLHRAGSRTVQEADVTAGNVTLGTGLNAIAMKIVQIVRAGKVTTTDASLSLTGTSIVVGPGASYALTAGDVINWLAFGD